MEVNVKEARQRFSELLDLAELGEDVVVTRRGKTVVRLVSVKPVQKPLPDLSEFRAAINPTGSLTDAVLQNRENERY